MATLSREQLAKSIRGIGLRQVRLVSGMVLFGYLVSHFLNHALGNVSMDGAREAASTSTRYSGNFSPSRSCSTPRVWCTPGSASGRCTNGASSAGRQSSRSSWCWASRIPALIIAHIVGVRLGQALFEHEKLYPQELYLFFVAAPMKLWQMFAVMVIAWVHGSHRPLFLAADEGVLPVGARRSCSPPRC